MTAKSSFCLTKYVLPEAYLSAPKTADRQPRAKTGRPAAQNQKRPASSPQAKTGRQRAIEGPKPAGQQLRAETGPAGRPRRSPVLVVNKNDDSITKIT